MNKLLLVLAMAAALSGCGGGGDEVPNEAVPSGNLTTQAGCNPIDKITTVYATMADGTVKQFVFIGGNSAEHMIDVFWATPGNVLIQGVIVPKCVTS